jgi:hypothetical protein
MQIADARFLTDFDGRSDALAAREQVHGSASVERSR